VRVAASRDLPDIGRLWQQMIEYHVRLDPRFGRVGDDRHSFLEYVRHGLTGPGMRILVAERNGQVLGFAIGTLRAARPGAEELVVGHISDLAVAPSAQRQGVGRQLADALRKWFRQNGVRAVTLNVSCANSGAQAFWRSQGFVDFMDRLWCELDNSSLHNSEG
jgi:ribosomal protein S18 acetylase RimI-like enzyme